MPSTYSPDLRIELIANGEQSGTWGTTTNNNLGTIIEDAISGTASVVTAVQKYALLAANGAVDEARCAILVLDTTYVGAGNYEVYAPPVTKLYVVKNASSTKDLDLYCATTINGTTAAGTVYTIPQGKTAFVRSNGLTFFDATDYVAGSVTFTDAELITPSLSGETFSTANTVAAGSNSQGSGALTADYNIITTAANNPSGVTLPTATQGRRIIIVNKGANPVNVYPATGGAIDALSTNASTQIPVDGVLEFNASSTTRWYSYSALTLTSPLITTPSLVAAKVSTSASVTAGSNSQGSGALTADYNVITSAVNNPSGVTLPTATVGRKVLVVNKGANAVNVYPATNAYIDAIAINTAISLPVGGLLEFNASSTTQWYSSYNATTASSVGGVSFTGTAPAAAGQVAVYSGTTGNSITTTRTYQFRSTNAGGAQIQLFEDTDNGVNSVTIQSPATLAADYTLTLPTALAGANGDVLSSTTGGVLSWVTPSSGGGVTSVTGSGAITASPTTGAVTVSVANAGSSTAGIVSTGSQTFGGAKTFNASITASAGITSTTFNFNSTSSIFLQSSSVKVDISSATYFTFNATNGNYSHTQLSPAADNSYSLGNTGQKWSAVWAVNGTIQTSDSREKVDIQNSAYGLSFINALRPVSYKWVNSGNPDANGVDTPGIRTHYGFIAQEVKELIGDGNNFGGYVKGDMADPTSLEGLRYHEFIAPMVKAIQELSAQVETLKAKVAALEGA
jgi:hypothetical protein